MATTTTNIPTLKINYLTKAQYDTALANNEINENELYFTEIPNDAEYLFLTGGNVTGPTSFGDSVNIDELTVGDLVVNGKLTTGGSIDALFGGGPVTYTTISGNFNTTVWLAKRNGIVTLVCLAGTAAPLTKGQWNTICTIPEAYRPFLTNERFMGIDNNTTSAALLPLEFYINNGLLQAYGNTDGPTNNQPYCAISYIGPEADSDESKAMINIPDYETSGSEDEALYNAITTLNWQSEVIE